MGGDGVRFELSKAMAGAAHIVDAMAGACERIEVAGSVRRRKATVGDVEIIYIPKRGRRPDPADMFAEMDVNLADEAIGKMEQWRPCAFEPVRFLERRVNALGRTTFGPKIKLMRFVPFGLPVDLFEATVENWTNYLVCRTGPADGNTLVATRAKARGWKWTPYGPGFVRLEDGATHAVKEERDVFDFVGLPYYEPEERWRLEELAKR